MTSSNRAASAKIAVVGPESLNFLLASVIEELKERYDSVHRYTDLTSFLSDEQTLAETDVLLTSGHLSCTRALMTKMSRLRAIVSPFSGTEGFDEKAATELGIVIAHGSPPENFESMAEATVMLMLECLYDLRTTEAIFRDNLPRPSPPLARMIKGKVIGLIGFGNVARAVARRLEGWQVDIQIYSRQPKSSLPAGVKQVNLDQLLRTSDIVSIHVRLNDETRGMLDRSRLHLLKPDAVLINTARGAVIDEAAIVALALERPDFKIALDVFQTEPLLPDNPLRKLPNAILTRHMVGHTKESIDALRKTAVENIARLLSGQLPLYLRNPEVISLWTSRWGDSHAGPPA